MVKRIDIVRTMIDFFGESVPGSATELSLLFNENIIHEDLVRELIENGEYMDDDRIVVTTVKKADLLFSGK